MTTGAGIKFTSPWSRPFVEQGRAEGQAEGQAEGLAKGRADGLLAVLAARGIEVPDDIRKRITSCADNDQLVRWLTAAATADSLDDVFG